MKSRASRIGFYIFLAAGFMALVCLGSWQMERRAWKEELLQAIDTRKLDAPLSIAGSLPELSKEKDEFKRVAVDAPPFPESYLVTPSRMGWKKADGKMGQPALGYDFILAYPYGEKFLLINMGWVDADFIKNAANEKYDLPQKIEGVIRFFPESKGLFTPDNEPQRNYWYWLDKSGIEKKIGKQLAPFYVVADSPFLNTYNREDAALNIANNHLVYAVTWYSLALVFLLVFILYSRGNDNR